jgi:hypothetical protein
MLFFTPKITSITTIDLFDGDSTIYTITDFSLPLGNNYYTLQRFVSALFECEQGLRVVDLVYSHCIDLHDMLAFEYVGSFGNHEDMWVMYDLMDYLRPEYNKFYA